jgi:integrase
MQNSKKPQRVYLICRWEGERLVYPTSFNVLPKNWNVRAGEVRNVIEEPNRDLINSYLSELKNSAKAIFYKAVADRKAFTKEYLKSELDKWVGKTDEKRLTLNDWIANYIEESKSRINPKTGRLISRQTILEYITTYKYLFEFEKFSKSRIDFDTYKVQTLVDFRDYLTNNKKFAVNNIAKHIDNVRQFIRAASETVKLDDSIVNSKKFIISREEPQDIYLNESDIDKLVKLDLSGNNTFERVRDLFLIGCYTGLRVSDFNNIKPHNIKDDRLEIFQQKTGAKVVIPLQPIVKEILNKYNGFAPPKISEQRLNDYIKEICKEAGLNETFEKRQTKGGQVNSKVFEKWELVTNHTARRSFATNMTKKGIPIQLIMKITGHKKESVFLKYVKLSALEYAEILQSQIKQGVISLNS